MAESRLKYKRFLTVMLLLSVCFYVGCPPMSRSIVVEEKPEIPFDVRSFTLDDRYYRVKEIYTVEQLKDRLSGEEISSVKLLMSDDSRITGGSIEIRDSTVCLYTEDRIEHEARMEHINAFILYREKTAAEKRYAFFSPILLFATGGAIRALHTEEASDILFCALIGVGLGIPTLFDKQKKTEVILNLKYKEELDLKYNPYTGQRN